jgi:hypothetical protein
VDGFLGVVGDTLGADLLSAEVVKGDGATDVAVEGKLQKKRFCCLELVQFWENVNVKRCTVSNVAVKGKLERKDFDVLELQWAQLNGITLGQRETDSYNQLILISEQT